jgi:predicted metal-dependent phosphoesterase TrpH
MLIIGLNMVLTSVVLPTYRYEGELEPNEFLFDFHSHTYLSDGSLSPEQRVRWYMQQGIHGAAISDHFHTKGAVQAREYVAREKIDFVVITAQEYTQYTPYVHMNVFGIDEHLTPSDQPGPFAPNQMNIPDMIQWVHDRGGYVIVNHYDSPDKASYSYEQLRDWGVDGFEIATFADERAPEIRQFCLANNLIMLSGTDEHINTELRLFTKVVLDDPTNLTTRAIFESLRLNRHEVVVVDLYADTLPWFTRHSYDIGNYFLGISAIQTLSWIIWSIGLYICGVSGLYAVRKRLKSL